MEKKEKLFGLGILVLIAVIGTIYFAVSCSNADATRAQEKRPAYEMKCVLTGPNFHVYKAICGEKEVFVVTPDTGVQPVAVSVVSH